MVDLDFIEIGTSDFNTLIQTCADTEVGISIEPIKYYLDKLPNRPNVKKINCAISMDDTESLTKIYHITEETIIKHKLSPKLKGCNSIGTYHQKHIGDLKELVTVSPVQQIPLSTILTSNDVRKIKFLKIDTEGADCYILNSFVPYLQSRSVEYWPEKIQFESNRLTPPNVIQDTVKTYELLGYPAETHKNDTILKLNKA